LRSPGSLKKLKIADQAKPRVIVGRLLAVIGEGPPLPMIMMEMEIEKVMLDDNKDPSSQQGG
jgi:hypothetical protein